VKPAPGRSVRALLLLVLSLLLLPSIAQAYLDPGTGSYVLQLLLGTLLGGLFALGLFWRRVLAFIKRIFKRGSGDDSGR
jgi:flagellar biosynthesis protein FliR